MRYSIQLSGNQGYELQTNSRKYALRRARELSREFLHHFTVWDSFLESENDTNHQPITYIKGKRQ